MKQSKLQADIDTDIKIERGLKMMEFATQYYLQRSYLRINPLRGSKVNETAEIMAELNQYLQVGQFQQERKREWKVEEERREGERGSKNEIGNAVAVEGGDARQDGGF
jgi:hypothetical protein